MKQIARIIWKHLDAWAGEAFTVAGLLIAWIVLPPGKTRDIIGIVCVGAFAIWTLFKVTLDKDEDA